MVSVIDSEEQIQRLIPYFDKMIAGGLVASSKVEVIRNQSPKGESTDLLPLPFAFAFASAPDPAPKFFSRF
jgi:hypothetical protein